MITAVIVSNSTNESLQAMTQKAVDSCDCDEIIVIEQQEGVVHQNCRTIHNACEKFNYNRALNLGIDNAKGDYIALCNNDLYFYAGFKAIAEIMKVNGIHSASPYCLNHKMIAKTGNHFATGYRIGHELLGYCIVIDRYILEQIGRLDERFDFYFSDNAYAEQIEKVGIMHYLLCNVFIDHYHNITFSSMQTEIRRNNSIQKAAQKWHGRTRT